MNIPTPGAAVKTKALDPQVAKALNPNTTDRELAALASGDGPGSAEAQMRLAARRTAVTR